MTRTIHPKLPLSKWIEPPPKANELPPDVHEIILGHAELAELQGAHVWPGDDKHAEEYVARLKPGQTWLDAMLLLQDFDGGIHTSWQQFVLALARAGYPLALARSGRYWVRIEAVCFRRTDGYYCTATDCKVMDDFCELWAKSHKDRCRCKADSQLAGAAHSTTTG